MIDISFPYAEIHLGQLNSSHLRFSRDPENQFNFRIELYSPSSLQTSPEKPFHYPPHLGLLVSSHLDTSRPHSPITLRTSPATLASNTAKMVKGLSSINTEYSKRSKARKRRRDATLVHQFPEGWNPHAHIDKEIEENALKLFDVDDNNTEWEENLRKEAFKARPLDPWLHKEVPKTEEELIQERVEKDLKDWPWRDNSRQAVMLGPHMFNNNPSSAGDMRPPVSGGEGCDQKQSLFFTKIVANRDVFAQIMYLVCAHHDSAWKFGVTCIQAYNYMVRSCMVSKIFFKPLFGTGFDTCLILFGKIDMEYALKSE